MTTLELIASRLTDLATQIEDLADERDSYREAAMRLRHELAEARKGEPSPDRDYSPDSESSQPLRRRVPFPADIP